ncbi:MAG TPA: universal stress protein [Isosphaeraceae bacterium]|nr:universal stress protein [Isosphaeraceae bacterium]
MLRRILIGLGGSDESRSALELGLRWAKSHDALLVGLEIVDKLGMPVGEEATSQAGAPELPRSGRPLLEWFARLCQEAGVDFLVRAAAGTPHLEILAEAQRHDLIVMGQRSHFDYGLQGAPGETLAKVVQGCPRPVIIVPDTLSTSDVVVVAYDGSIPAAQALYTFGMSGLGVARDVHVVTIGTHALEAARIAERAIDFLDAHGIKAEMHPVESALPPAEVILGRVGQIGAGLLVMGAYGKSVLRELIYGSVARALLKVCPVPVFVFH